MENRSCSLGDITAPITTVSPTYSVLFPCDPVLCIARIVGWKSILPKHSLKIVPPEDHNGSLDMEALVAHSDNFCQPVLFRKLAPVPAGITERQYYEISLDQATAWSEPNTANPDAFRNEDGSFAFGHIRGERGTGAEFVSRLFDGPGNCYAMFGHAGAFMREEMRREQAYGVGVFDKLRRDVFDKSDWFRVSQWELTGHAFIGRSDVDFGSAADGHAGSDWHMFPTLNVFVQLAGVKRWRLFTPQLGDAFSNQAQELVTLSGGREGRSDIPEGHSTIDLEPGDVLLVPPYEWHEVSNAKGFSCGVGFRVKDREYVKQLSEYDNYFTKAVDTVLYTNDPIDEDAMKVAAKRFLEPLGPEELERVDYLHHELTSLRYAANDPRRMGMALNRIELFHLYSWAAFIRNAEGQSNV